MTSAVEPQPPALRVSGLGFNVGGIEILTNVDLFVPAGTFLGIIGPNGAGKTTFLNLLSGLLTPTSGLIELEGRSVERLATTQRSKLGLGRTFQTSSVFGGLSVFENARLSAQSQLGGSARFWRGPRSHDKASIVALDALATVGLDKLAERMSGSLSHGDKRKLELAILIAGEARVLLLDEPMAGVNSEDVPKLTDLIGRLHSEGRTVLMVEHHMAVVVGLADAIAVFDSGRLLAMGDPQSVIANADVQSAYLGQPL